MGVDAPTIKAMLQHFEYSGSDPDFAHAVAGERSAESRALLSSTRPNPRSS
jgi:hypothetical protein